MSHEPRRAVNELLRLLARTRPDWREGDILQVIRHLEHIGWPWPRILTLFPTTAAETDSRPGDVINGWRPPDTTGRPPTDEYRAARARLAQHHE